MNRWKRRSNRRGILKVLGYELKTPPPNPKAINIVGHSSKFVMNDAIPDADIVDAKFTFCKEHSRLPGF